MISLQVARTSMKVANTPKKIARFSLKVARILPQVTKTSLKVVRTSLKVSWMSNIPRMYCQVHLCDTIHSRVARIPPGQESLQLAWNGQGSLQCGRDSYLGC